MNEDVSLSVKLRIDLSNDLKEFEKITRAIKYKKYLDNHIEVLHIIEDFIPAFTYTSLFEELKGHGINKNWQTLKNIVDYMVYSGYSSYNFQYHKKLKTNFKVFEVTDSLLTDSGKRIKHMIVNDYKMKNKNLEPMNEKVERKVFTKALTRKKEKEFAKELANKHENADICQLVIENSIEKQKMLDGSFVMESEYEEIQEEVVD